MPAPGQGAGPARRIDPNTILAASASNLPNLIPPFLPCRVFLAWSDTPRPLSTIAHVWVFPPCHLFAVVIIPCHGVAARAGCHAVLRGRVQLAGTAFAALGELVRVALSVNGVEGL